jgi:hypothetical protein
VPVHDKCIASQGLRAGPGVLPTELGAIWPREAGAWLLRRVRPTCSEIEMYGRVASCYSTSAPVSLGFVASGYQDDRYKLLSSCILARVLDKGEPTAR